MSFGDKAFDVWDWFVGLFYDSYGWRPWTIVPGAFLIVAVVFGAALGLSFLLFPEQGPQPATVYMTNGKTVHCDDGHWYGGGFGASNKFNCDGIVYTITVIDHVEEN